MEKFTYQDYLKYTKEKYHYFRVAEDSTAYNLQKIHQYKDKGYTIVNITSVNQGSQNGVIYDEGNLFRKLFDLGSSKTLVVCEYGNPVSYINY